MTLHQVVLTLEDLVGIHHELLQISKEKTTFVTKGEVDEFQKLLLKERKLILRLEKAEKARQEAVEQWFSDKDDSIEHKTITHMLDLITDQQEQTMLANITTDLTEAITTLKRQEQLNHDLLEQSMQFVQMSLNMLSPSIEQMNYGEKKQTNQRDRSVFDSRA